MGESLLEKEWWWVSGLIQQVMFLICTFAVAEKCIKKADIFFKKILSLDLPPQRKWCTTVIHTCIIMLRENVLLRTWHTIAGNLHDTCSDDSNLSCKNCMSTFADWHLKIQCRDMERQKWADFAHPYFLNSLPFVFELGLICPAADNWNVYVRFQDAWLTYERFSQRDIATVQNSRLEEPAFSFSQDFFCLISRTLYQPLHLCWPNSGKLNAFGAWIILCPQSGCCESLCVCFFLNAVTHIVSETYGS